MSGITTKPDELQQTSRPKKIDLLTAYKTLLDAHIRTQGGTVEHNQSQKPLDAQENPNTSKDQNKSSAQNAR